MTPLSEYVELLDDEELTTEHENVLNAVLGKLHELSAGDPDGQWIPGERLQEQITAEIRRINQELERRDARLAR